MNITTITVKVQRLIALAKYENVTYSVEATSTVGELEDANTVYDDTLQFCKGKVLTELERIEASKKGS